MKSVTGVFRSQSEAMRAIGKLQSEGLSEDRVSLLAPGSLETTELKSVPTVSAEQPGMGKAIGAVVGGSAGLSGGLAVAAAMVPGVGLITTMGLLGGALLAAAGAGIGAAAGAKLEDSMTQGLPEDELFVYEDALRKGRSVVIALASDDAQAARFRELLIQEGAESIDAARDQWWIGLRGAEEEHYSTLGRKFGQEEKYYRMGFEAALHARMRCREFDQVASEMSLKIEALERENPGVEVAEPYRRGYERGREHYQHLCEESKAA